MITLEVVELNEHIRQVYYRDHSGVVIREVCYDRQGKVITDELTEFNERKQVITSVIYGGDAVMLAYREYYYDDGVESGFTDYKLKNGTMAKVCLTKSYWVKPNQIARCDWFDAKNSLKYYDIFKEQPDIGMCFEQRFYPDGTVFDFGDLNHNSGIEIYHSGWLDLLG